ncbi:MAG: UDP-N-acetylglucosamine 1-carboxyvinyltransferase [Bacteroidetes bacterium]|nr:UDP-N-acetylglucosamine 1-carboxyvinyltransferase [Bacteroidota bacterium]
MINRIRVSGAKNSATRVLAASLISDEKCTLINFPTELVDANHKKRFINNMGGIVSFNSLNETALIESVSFNDEILSSYDYPIRTTYLLVPGLLKKNGIARIPYPGGCKIGHRGYDLHIMVWESLGAVVTEKKDYIEVVASELKGNTINFPISTIGGTESALICGSIAIGETIIKNAYVSPEVNDLIAFLKSIGVQIEVHGNSYIRVVGNKYLRGTSFEIMPDRIEAITWIIFAVLSGRNLQIDNVPFREMAVPLLHLKDAGIDYYSNNTSVLITEENYTRGIQPFELATGTHPGIISDMQPFYVLLGLKANGISRIYDYRYPERIAYLKELQKFTSGGLEGISGKITINGVQNFKPAEADSTDLRGSMAVLMAALLSGNNGESIIHNISMALRGYNKLENKLNQLGYKLKIENGSAII